MERHCENDFGSFQGSGRGRTEKSSACDSFRDASEVVSCLSRERWCDLKECRADDVRTILGNNRLWNSHELVNYVLTQNSNLHDRWITERQNLQLSRRISEQDQGEGRGDLRGQVADTFLEEYLVSEEAPNIF